MLCRSASFADRWRERLGGLCTTSGAPSRGRTGSPHRALPEDAEEAEETEVLVADTAVGIAIGVRCTPKTQHGEMILRFE